MKTFPYPPQHSASKVQGEESVAQIVETELRTLHKTLDLVLLTRGGGSLEDLWSFNTEPVARAIRSAGCR